MTQSVSLRARRPRRARSRRFFNTLARSWLLEGLARSAVIFVIVFGLLLTGWGLLSEFSSFTTDLSKLVQFAGSGEAVFSSTLGLFQNQVLVMLGLADPPSADEAAQQVPQTGALVAVATPQPPPGAGFIPYQVEVDQAPEAALLAQQAPTLPPIALSVPGPAAKPTTSPPPPAVPGWIVIPRIDLDAAIVVSHTKMVVVGGKTFAQWEAPDLYAGGWQEGSALLGEPGNTVLNGHHNVYGGVFGRLYELKPYDEIMLYSGEREFHYLVSQVMKIKERDATLEQRLENARWIMHSPDERLTLVTCWPPTNNTYRFDRCCGSGKVDYKTPPFRPICLENTESNQYLLTGHTFLFIIFSIDIH